MTRLGISSQIIWIYMFFHWNGSISAQSDGLQCYECGEDSSFGSCADFSTSDKYVTGCPSQYQSCLTTVGSFGDFEVRSKKCGIGAATNACSSMEIGGAMATVCSCEGSLCNLSNPVISSKLLMTIPLILYATSYCSHIYS
ncbi:hypothetical protein TCAL_08481 [Tigriopus californicus]|uniref:Protein sleepless n=1 Tax=Tigriopus californicus TaxID=6832 RepID=A0A553NR54_TIGCA|nr:uncharacterized protein LOC131879080 [Tigriopus californicus]TRY67914.1 hypothetical protein TCAL_08481 [Tigriopus californicus]|eukprot:TCALIF_08481-PA protein Name:"Protein of unknown function" AED:0.00 eAED:0.00 QI:389/1/1/1/0.5/0.33/3/32/140